MKTNSIAGIDFGNQNCVLSVPSEHGVDIVLNQSSSRYTPTMVTLCDERRYAGEFSQQQQMQHIQRTITQIKRLIGLPYESNEREIIEKLVPFKLVKQDNGTTGIQIDDGKTVAPEQCIAFLLKSLMDIIKMKKPNVDQLVLTVSPWWTEIQRRALLNAASIADIKIAALLNSTTAAAISYAKIHSDRLPEPSVIETKENESDEKKEMKEKFVNVAFIDFGDSSMNIAIASINKAKIIMKSFASDETIGGSFFTEPLYEYLLEKVQEKYKIDPRTNQRALLRFRNATEKAKKTLSANPVVIFEVPSLMNDIDVSITIKRDEYNELIQKLLEKIAGPIETALEKANLKKEDINTVEVLGGGSRVPSVKSQIKEIFGCEPMMSLDLDECFAIGAGYLAAQLSGTNIGLEIQDICPYSIEIHDESKEEKTKIMNEFSIIPSEASFSIPVTKEAKISILSNKNEIGELSISTQSEESMNVDVSLSLDKFGIIEIKKATHTESNSESNSDSEDASQENNNESRIINIPFEYSPLLTIDDIKIAEYSKIENELANKDKLELQIDNARNDLEGLIFGIQNAINCDNLEFFNGENVDEIKSKISDIQCWWEENEFERLSLQEYESRIDIIKSILTPIMEFKKKYQNNYEKLVEYKQKASKALETVKKDTERIAIKESVELQKKIPEFISKIDELLNKSKLEIAELDLSKENMEQEINELLKNANSLKEIEVKKKMKKIRRRKPRAHRRAYRDPWSSFGGFFDDDWGNPFMGRRKYNDNDYEYEYEYEYVEDDGDENAAEQLRKQKLEEENKRRQALLEEQKKRAAIEAERRRKAQLEAEERRKAAIEAERQRRAKLEEEAKRRYAIEAERRRKAQLEEEERRKAAIEAERQRKLKLEEEAQKRAAIEAEHQKQATLEAEAQKATQLESEQSMQESDQELLKKATEEAEARKKAQIEQEKRAKEADKLQAKTQRDPWVTNGWGDPTSWGDPWGFEPIQKKRVIQQPRQSQTRRNYAPGFFAPWAF